ncbi:B'ETA [Symbiodinium sp. CCMP2592]|nr:B'ETA [Symbiodinium sp. CCMP2592]
MPTKTRLQPKQLQALTPKDSGRKSFDRNVLVVFPVVVAVVGCALLFCIRHASSPTSVLCTWTPDDCTLSLTISATPEIFVLIVFLFLFVVNAGGTYDPDCGQLDNYLQSDYSTRLGSLKAVHWDRVYTALLQHRSYLKALPHRRQCQRELLLEGRHFEVPFTLADPILTVMHLLVHTGYHPHSVQFKFTHVEAPQHQPDQAGRPMLMVSLPFPAAAQRISGAPAVAYFGHNTDLQAAFGILKEGCIRPSNFDPLDDSWLPSPAFYSRASVNSLSGALRAAAKFGGWGSPRPICVYGRIPICYLDIANAAPADTPSSVLPNTPAGYHLKSDSGGTVPENAANYFVSILHGNDNRWGVHSTLAQPEGIAVFM